MSPEKDYGKLDFTKTCLICTAQVYWKTTGINCSEYQQLEGINNMLNYHLFSQSNLMEGSGRNMTILTQYPWLLNDIILGCDWCLWSKSLRVIMCSSVKAGIVSHCQSPCCS